MKSLLLTIGFAISGLLTSLTQAQVVPLTIDPSQSSIEISIAGVSSSSPVSGSATIELQASTAQVSDLNLVFDEALSYTLFSGFATAFTSPGDGSLSLLTPGPAGTVSGTSFTQTGNSLALGGNLTIIDDFGFAGGSRILDLSEIEILPTDFNSVNVSQFGNNN